ncbi:MAG: hypothetical protein ACLPN5_08940, partial [Roseiarcus sp.]
MTSCLAACSPGVLEERQDGPQNAADAIRSADLSARSPTAASAAAAPASGSRGFSIFGASEPAKGAAPQKVSADATGAVETPPGVNSDPGGFTLNFENGPIATVVKAVLGDTLGFGYVIDQRAQGAISLSTGGPIQKKDLL